MTCAHHGAQASARVKFQPLHPNWEAKAQGFLFDDLEVWVSAPTLASIALCGLARRVVLDMRSILVRACVQAAVPGTNEHPVV